MNVWLTPGLQPFVGGTYFPPEDGLTRVGFRTVLMRICDQVGGCLGVSGQSNALQDSQGMSPLTFRSCDFSKTHKTPLSCLGTFIGSWT